MLLFAGLGNPGAKYARNRHNIGFMALDAIASREGASWRAKFQGEIAEIRFGSRKVVLLKPATFMNLSGQSVGEAARFYGIAAEEVTVFHDELDLGPGRLKVKRGGGHAGHNGLRSIHSHLGADYRRVRLGIGHPGHKDRVSGYVLHDFPKADLDWVEPLIDASTRSIGHLVEGDDARFQSEVARLAPPPARLARGPAMHDAAPAPGSVSPQAQAEPQPGPGKSTVEKAELKDAPTSPFEALKGLFKR
ncbi:MAG: aminoacyl-tRNA hydrolase [Pseudomonadota bacterium]